MSLNPRESRRPRVMTRQHKRPSSLQISSMNSTFYYRNTLSRFFWESILTKASEPLWPAPNRCQIRSTFFALAGRPSIGLVDSSPLIFQQHQLVPSVGNAHFAVSPHLYKRAAWSKLDRWMSTHTCSPLVASLQK